MPTSRMVANSLCNSGLVTAGPNHHHRIIGRASAGGSAKCRCNAIRESWADKMVEKENRSASPLNMLCAKGWTDCMNLLASGLIELLLFAGLKRNPSEAGEHSRYLSGIRVVSTVRTHVFQPSSQGIPFGRH